jgi:hypothetical protein
MIPTVGDLLACAPDLNTQLCLLVIQATIWFLFIPWFAKTFAEPYLKAHPMCEQWTDLSQATFKASFGVDFNKPEAFKFGCIFIAILVQHGLGGLLCVPAVTGIPALSASLAATLARHGALCEAGWELQDGLYRIYQVLFGGEEGKAMNPVPLRVIIFIHHAMGMSLVVPMNIYYSDNYWYFYLVLLLQLAAFVAMFIQNYGFTLDITTQKGLCQMKVAVTVVFVVMWFSRGIGYAYVIYKLLCAFWATNIHFFIVGCAVAFLMSLLNMLFIVDCSGKFKKFIFMKISEEEMKKKPLALKRKMSYQAFAATGSTPTGGDGDGTIGEDSQLKFARRLSRSLTREAAKAREPGLADSREPLLRVA